MSLVVQFDNESSGDIAGFAWLFDDGTFDTEVSPLHVFPIAGTYNVALYAIGIWGDYDKIVKPVSVTDEFHVCYDFTLSDYLFVPGAGSAAANQQRAVYIPGVGWQGSPLDPTVNTVHVYIVKNFTPTIINRIKWSSNIVTPGLGGRRQTRMMNPSVVNQTVNFESTNLVFNNVGSSGSGTITTDLSISPILVGGILLEVQGQSANPALGATILSVELFGTGTPPVDGVNC